MKSLYTFAKRFVREEDGATAIEYGLIAALISITLIAGAKLAGTQVSTTFNKAGTEMQTANGAAP